MHKESVSFVICINCDSLLLNTSKIVPYNIQTLVSLPLTIDQQRDENRWTNRYKETL